MVYFAYIVTLYVSTHVHVYDTNGLYRPLRWIRLQTNLNPQLRPLLLFLAVPVGLEGEKHSVYHVHYTAVSSARKLDPLQRES